MAELLLLIIHVEANVIAYMDGTSIAHESELRRRMWNNIVGCRTCYGRGYIVVGQSWQEPYGEQEQCPDCL